MGLAEKIRELRTAKTLTQKELAGLSGVAEISIRQYENNKRQPKLEQIQKIAIALGCTVDFLLGNTDDPNTEVRVVTTRSINPDKAGAPVRDIKELFEGGKEETVTEEVKYVDADEYFKDADKIGKTQLTIQTKGGEKAEYLLIGDEADAVKKVIEVLKKKDADPDAKKD